MLLPEGFRDFKSAKTYPLPSTHKELRKLTQIAIPPGVRDSGYVYIKRAESKWKSFASRKLSAALDTAHRAEQIKTKQQKLSNEMNACLNEAREAVNQVKKEAEKQIANLSDLFSLGRQGIEGQMKAHLSGTDWKEERISARDFRECFRMVSQAVHALGVPSEQRDKAREAVLREAAEAAESTKEALALAPGGKDPEVAH